MVENTKYLNELERLKSEQELLEEEINQLMKGKVINHFLIINLRKKHLQLKEAITIIYSNIYGDIIA